MLNQLMKMLGVAESDIKPEYTYYACEIHAACDLNLTEFECTEGGGCRRTGLCC